MSKKIGILFVSLLVALLLGVGACGNPTVEIPDPGNEYEVNIDFSDEEYNQTAKLTVGITSDAFEKTIIEAAAEGFAQLFPNVIIEPVIITGSSYEQAVNNRITVGNMTDVLFTSETEGHYFIAKKIFLNLKPYVDAEHARNGEYVNQFVSEAWRMGQPGYDGDQYFVPRSSDRIVTHLNTSYIDAAIGAWNTANPSETLPADIVKNGWTWDDFLKVCGALRDYFDTNGKTGHFVVDHSFGFDPVLFSMFKSFGADISAANGDFAIDNENTKAMLEAMRALITNKYVGSGTQGANYESGQGAMLFHSSSAMQKYSNFIGENYDVVTFPVINGADGTFGYGVPGYGVYAGISEGKRDLAWQFLNYVISYDGQETLAAAGGNMKTPSVRTDLQDFATAKWGEGLRTLNLAATTYQNNRNYSETFFLKYDIEKKNALTSAVKKLVTDAMRYDSKGEQADFTVETCISECIKALNKAIVAK